MSEGKKGYVMIALAGLLGLLLIALALSPGREAQAFEPVGVAAKVTPRSCDFMMIEGRELFFCHDGHEGFSSPFVTGGQ